MRLFAITKSKNHFTIDKKTSAAIFGCFILFTFVSCCVDCPCLSFRSSTCGISFAGLTIFPTPFNFVYWHHLSFSLLNKLAICLKIMFSLNVLRSSNSARLPILKLDIGRIYPMLRENVSHLVLAISYTLFLAEQFKIF